MMTLNVNAGDLIRAVQDLSPLPASTVRLTQMIVDSRCGLNDVTELIAFDQALTMKLLRAANSAVSGSHEPVGNVGEAVARMGTAQVLTLAVASGTKSSLQAGIPGYGLAEGALWRHSVAAAVGAEVAPSHCRVEIPPESFTAALLHDVGKLVLGRFLTPEIRGQILQAQSVDGLSLLEAEARVLSVHHAQLGGMIASHWNLPASVVKGITHHHAPAGGEDVICDLTYVANHIAKRIEAELDGRRYEPDIDSEAMERLGMTEDGLEELWMAAIARYSEVKMRYNAV
jgi:HD-like signal output (HDOD) protein